MPLLRLAAVRQTPSAQSDGVGAQSDLRAHERTMAARWAAPHSVPSALRRAGRPSMSAGAGALRPARHDAARARRPEDIRRHRASATRSSEGGVQFWESDGAGVCRDARPVRTSVRLRHAHITPQRVSAGFFAALVAMSGDPEGVRDVSEGATAE